MTVCGECIIIPNNNFNYIIIYSGKKNTCCKCKEYKEYVRKVLIKN